MRFVSIVAAAAMLALGGTHAAATRSLLFIGNSFTYGANSPVQFYRAQTVTDLNNEGIGGVPALVKSFTVQAGLDYDISLETRGGSGLDFHLENKLAAIGSKPWDAVVMHGHSLLDSDKPGDPARLVAAARKLAEVLRERNPRVEIFLTATWSRADQTYQGTGPWAGKPIEVMARDVRAAYDKAAAAPGIKAVIPVGEAWTRAIQAGIADPNPYDGIEPGKFDLWSYDHYHASTHGYYLEALMVFATLTGRDPRSLGDTECSGFELGLSRRDVKALQEVAANELANGTAMTPPPATTSAGPQRCSGAAR